MDKWFPDLEKQNSDIFSKLEKIQFYNDPNNRTWMKEFNIVNEYKHKDFSKQQIVKSKVLNLGTKDASIVLKVVGVGKFEMVNCNINEIKVDKLIIENGQVTEGSKIPDLKITESPEKEYCFIEINKTVSMTLLNIKKGIDNLIKEFEK